MRTRSRQCVSHRASRGAPAPLRESVDAVPRPLPSQSCQPELRAPPPAVLRAESSSRRLRRDFRRRPRLPQPRVEEALRGMAGAQEARVRGEASGDAGPQTTAPSQSKEAGLAADARHHAARVLRGEARAVSRQLSRYLRRRSAPAVFERSETSPPRVGLAFHPAQQHGDPKARVDLDRRISVHARAGAQRHDRPQPRAQASRGGTGAASARRVRDPTHSEDNGLALPQQELACTMKRKRLRVVALMHPSTVPPDNPDDYSERQAYEWKTEFDVLKTLKKLGHKVRVVAVRDELP